MCLIKKDVGVVWTMKRMIGIHACRPDNTHNERDGRPFVCLCGVEWSTMFDASLTPSSVCAVMALFCLHFRCDPKKKIHIEQMSI